jgi:hypothetical protein
MPARDSRSIKPPLVEDLSDPEERGVETHIILKPHPQRSVLSMSEKKEGGISCEKPF